MKIKIYTAPDCFYCKQLKELLKRAEIEDYEQQVIVVGKSLEEFKVANPNAKGYPYVIIDDEPIGGLIETARLFIEKGLVSSGKR